MRGCLLLFCLGLAPGAFATERYAIHLTTNDRGFSAAELDRLRSDQLKPYVTVYETDEGVSYLLRVGGYESMDDAFVVLQTVTARYPKAWIVAIDPAQEQSRAATDTLAPGPAPGLASDSSPANLEATPGARPNSSPETARSFDATGALDTAATANAAGALDAAGAAAAGGDFNRAIQLYTKATRIGGPSEQQQALELLGVARERNGQEAHAKSVYERYLETYPDGPASERVDQRLAGLVTRDLPMNGARAEPRRQASNWAMRGLLSQYYRRYAYTIDGADEIVSIDALFSDLNVAVTRRRGQLDSGITVRASHVQDFGRSESEVRLTSAHLDFGLSHPEISVRAGRQSRHAAGILGRFDGVFVEAGITPWLSIGSVGGFAVRSTFDQPNTDRPFYGVSVTVEDPDNRWQIEPFAIEQQADGLTDRRAVGAEARYYGDRLTAFSLLDYDVYHEVWNNAHLIGHFNVNEQWRLHASYDHRRSPYLTTQNALIGQGLEDLSDLERDYADQEILDLAADRTATADIASLGVERMFGDRYRASFDVSASDYSETEASGDVPATPARTDIYYLGQLRANDVLGDGSFASLQLRYADGETADIYSAYLMTRFPITTALHVYPRLRYDHRDYALTGQTQTQWIPSFRFEYRRPRLFNVELEVGYQWTRRELASRDLDATGYFVRAGYRSQF